jgi:hypothetical protein
MLFPERIFNGGLIVNGLLEGEEKRNEGKIEL